MKSSKYFLIIFLALVLSYDISEAQEAFIYAAAAEGCDVSPPGANSVLYIVDPTDASSSLVGPIGFNGVTGLAILGDGRLVATANADEDGTRVAVFIEIDPNTGQGTLIGEIGNEDNPGECGRVPDITYDPVTNTLYGVARRCFDFGSSNVFISINQNTGQATVIGNIGSPGSGNGLARRDDGTIFWAFDGPGPARLSTLNPANGMRTDVANLSQDNATIGGLAFHPITQVLYAGNTTPGPPFVFADTTLEILDTTTGELTLVGQFPNCADAIVFAELVTDIPTLSEWGLIAMAGVLGIIGLLAIHRKKQLSSKI